MANIRVTCPACKSELEIDEAFDGQEVECGNCLEVFKANKPGGAGRSGTGKIPGAGKSSSAGTSGAGSSRSKPADKPARKKRRDEDDDDYEHDRRRRDDDDEDYAPPPPRRRRGSGPGDGAATASLVLGIVSIIPGCCCGLISIPAGIAAVVTGFVGLKSQSNKGMAVGGIVLGCIGLGIFGVSIFAGLGNAVVNPRQFR